jgi:hypothetical protein
MRRRIPAARAVGAALALWCVAGLGDDASHAAKAKPKGRPPALKILSVDPTPLPFIVTKHPLTLTITVELPKTLPEEALLDVTTLITSPSRSSIRLLTSRQTLTDGIAADAVPGDGDPRRIEIIQTWDGTDHTKSIVADGIYDYQVQAKLMVVGKNGPVTKEMSWRKRGTVEVRTR